MANLSRVIHAANDETIRSARFNPVTQLYRWIRISGVTSTLQQLDDRTLDDIGIARGEIRAYAEKLITKEHTPAA